MKTTKNTVLTVWIALLLLTMASCGKDGAIGPDGPEGPKGEQGIRGEKGENGTTIFSGAVVPPANLGIAGDFYFRTATSDFYGPKTADGWGTAVNLRGATGAQGQAGADGSKIHHGAGVPAAAIGAIGDYYLRTSDATLYGPKTAAGWGAYISLVGPAGPQGPQGPAGPAGPAGSANVIYSGWLSFQQAQRDTVIDMTPLKVNHFGVTRLTQNIIDQGVVIVYMRFGSTVVSLPYTSTPAGGNLMSTIDFLPRSGRLFVTRYTHDGSRSHGLGGVLQFRYVLIPGGVSAHANLRNINMHNYEAVKTALTLPD